MQENETIISGIIVPKRKGRTAKIVAVVLCVGVIAGGVYLVKAGRADGIIAKTVSIARQSWNEALGFSSDAPLAAEVDLHDEDTMAEDQSSTIDGVASSSPAIGQDNFLAAAPKKLKKKKISKVSAVVDFASTTNDANVTTTEISADYLMPASATSLDDVAITDPIVVADDSAESSSTESGGDVASSSLTKPSVCSFSNIVTSTMVQRVILNEIAWMGSSSTTDETTTKAANQEWIELKNITQMPISLANWQVANASGTVDITFGLNEQIAPGGLYLLSRDGDAVRGIAPDKAYLGGLANAGGILGVFDAGCGVSDLLDASQGWPGGDNATKQTLERKVGGNGWQTSALPGGTPDMENSVGAVLTNSDGTASSSLYAVEVTLVGDGAGKVTSKPAGISCSTNGSSVCTANFAWGTSLAFSATPASNATFAGWSGPCFGVGSCSFAVGGMVSVMAQFRSAISPLGVNEVAPVASGDSSGTDVASTSVGSASSSASSATSTVGNVTPTPVQASAVSLTHIVIAQIQIAGASSSNDFVKLYNPTAAAIDMSGWKLHKKSSTGTDYSLRTFANGTVIAPGAYFVWANSAGGFAQSMGADVSSTETLAADNSVAIMDASGTIVDAVAWGTGTNQYVEGLPYATDPLANQILVRKSLGDVMVDTDNNAEDFTLE